MWGFFGLRQKKSDESDSGAGLCSRCVFVVNIRHSIYSIAFADGQPYPIDFYWEEVLFEELVPAPHSSLVICRKEMTMNEWIDCTVGGPLPSHELRKPLDRELKVVNGTKVFYVALWYQHGNPLMGRCWAEEGKVAAAFTDGTKVFTGKSIIGALQVLGKNSPLVTGLDYCWKPFNQVVPASSGAKWTPLQIQFIVPCILEVRSQSTTEILGSVNLKNETAHAVTYDYQVISFAGQDIHNFLILCTRPNDETMAI